MKFAMKRKGKKKMLGVKFSVVSGEWWVAIVVFIGMLIFSTLWEGVRKEQEAARGKRQ